MRTGFLAIQSQKISWSPTFGKTGNSLKVIPDAFNKVCFCTICLIRALLCNDAGPLGQAYVLKALTHEVDSNGPLSL
jgi:hypothetical protein